MSADNASCSSGRGGRGLEVPESAKGHNNRTLGTEYIPAAAGAAGAAAAAAGAAAAPATGCLVAAAALGFIMVN